MPLRDPFFSNFILIIILVPNSVLLLKVFRKQHCTPDDLTHVSIHSVATLMQDTLWCCQERIVPKKVWRVINYESKGKQLKKNI